MLTISLPYAKLLEERGGAMFLTNKQKEYINNANRRYNIKVGAT